MHQLNTREVYANAWMKVREDAIQRSDGSEGIYGVVDKPDYALIIPFEADQLYLVEQFRYPLGLRRWEFPQGTAPNRSEMERKSLAARELREETGLNAMWWVTLGELDVAPGFCSQRGGVFLATDLRAGAPDREAEEQDMRGAWFSRAEFERMLRSGEVTDAQSLAAYTLLLLYERQSR